MNHFLILISHLSLFLHRAQVFAEARAAPILPQSMAVSSAICLFNFTIDVFMPDGVSV
jgi:uncharacterized protein (DUF4213/DUF364 family)